MTTNSKSSNGPLMMIGILFFVFGFITWVNSVLIAFFKEATGSLSAGINDSIFINGNGAHDGLVREWVKFPKSSIVGEQSFIVGKIHPPFAVLINVPGLGTRPEVVLVKIDDLRYSNGILTIDTKGLQYQKCHNG